MPDQTVALKKIAKTKASAKKTTTKYVDKSEGQPGLVKIFDEIKLLMKPFVKGVLKERGEKAGMYHLVSEKKIEVEGRKKDEVYFASIMIQKGFVGFYYMPIYMYDKIAKALHPDFLKCLKGKACFHIKKDTPQMMAHIKEALEVGLESYKERGWL